MRNWIPLHNFFWLWHKKVLGYTIGIVVPTIKMSKILSYLVIDRYRYIPKLIYRYRYRLEKIIKYHIGIDIGNCKIQISVSVLVKSIKAFVEKPLFLVTKVSISFKFSHLLVYNYVFTQSRLFLVFIYLKNDSIGIGIGI